MALQNLFIYIYIYVYSTYICRYLDLYLYFWLNSSFSTKLASSILLSLLHHGCRTSLDASGRRAFELHACMSVT